MKFKKPNIFIIGPSQSGKTTLAKELASDLGFIQYSASNAIKELRNLHKLFKNKIENREEITKISLETLQSDDKAISRKIHETIADGGFVIDGIRNPTDFVCNFNSSKDFVVLLDGRSEDYFEMSGIQTIEKYLGFLITNEIFKGEIYGKNNINELKDKLCSK